MPGMWKSLRGVVLLCLVLAGCGGAPDATMSAPADESTALGASSDVMAESLPSTDEAHFGSEDTFAMDDLTETFAMPETTGAPGWEVEASEPAMAAADDPPAGSSVPAATGGSSYTTRSGSPRSSSYGASSGRDVRSSSSISHVDEIVGQLDHGTVGFYTPSELPFGETFVQEVVLSPTESEAVLRSAMSNPAAPAEFVGLQVAPRMEATLTGSGFEIEPLSEPLQVVTSHRPTKWRFNVTPIAHGRQQLHLSLLAHIDVDGRDAPLTVETRDAVIEVDITVSQRLAGVVSKHWQWIWAAVIVPAIGFVWRRKTGRKPPEQREYLAKAA